MSAFRVGHGYDVHRLEGGDGIVLGGVRIACPYRVVAHSDGDVAVHALCDALLGASALGDIGHFFPDTDPAYRGVDSRTLLREVVRRVAQAGFTPANVDISLIAEVPRVAPHVAAMRANLAADLGLAVAAVSVKATTHERLGALGRKEGIAAHAVTLLTQK
jgi:2-C-methyl-D-erythritol 2,4-cyclodiphosphate synthase